MHFSATEYITVSVAPQVMHGNDDDRPKHKEWEPHLLLSEVYCAIYYLKNDSVMLRAHLLNASKSITYKTGFRFFFV